MLNRRIHTPARAVLVGAALALCGPGLAAADVVADAPATAARRRPRPPSSSPPLVVAEPDDIGPTPKAAIPVSDTPVGEAPPPGPLLPAAPEPTPIIEPDAVPISRPDAGPPEIVRADHPVAPPSGRLPLTGGATAAALGGAFLSLGGVCVGAGHRKCRRG